MAIDFDGFPIYDGIIQDNSTYLSDVWMTSFSTFYDSLVQNTFNYTYSSAFTVQMQSNTGYVNNNTYSVNFNLPKTASFGDIIKVNSMSISGFKITQNNGQSIQVDTSTTTAGTDGYIQSSNIGVCVTLVCVEENIKWLVESQKGSITVV